MCTVRRNVCRKLNNKRVISFTQILFIMPVLILSRRTVYVNWSVCPQSYLCKLSTWYSLRVSYAQWLSYSGSLVCDDLAGHSRHSVVHFTKTWISLLPPSQALTDTYEVCSKCIQIGTVVVVHWVGCVCSQSWHVRTCLSNSWHKLQVAAIAQLAVVVRGSNTCVYVIAIFTMCESTEQWICIKFCFKIGKTATETYQLL